MSLFKIYHKFNREVNEPTGLTMFFFRSALKGGPLHEIDKDRKVIVIGTADQRPLVGGFHERLMSIMSLMS